MYVYYPEFSVLGLTKSTVPLTKLEIDLNSLRLRGYLNNSTKSLQFLCFNIYTIKNQL